MQSKRAATKNSMARTILTAICAARIPPLILALPLAFVTLVFSLAVVATIQASVAAAEKDYSLAAVGDHSVDAIDDDMLTGLSYQIRIHQLEERIAELERLVPRKRTGVERLGPEKRTEGERLVPEKRTELERPVPEKPIEPERPVPEKLIEPEQLVPEKRTELEQPVPEKHAALVPVAREEPYAVRPLQEDSNIFKRYVDSMLQPAQNCREWQTVDERVKLVLTDAGQHFGGPVMMTSCYRSAAYNRTVYRRMGRRPTRSQHIFRKAIDAKIAGVSSTRLAAYVRAHPVMRRLGGVGTYCTSPGMVHVDVGPKRNWHWGCGRAPTRTRFAKRNRSRA
jgi:hypothetical protein